MEELADETGVDVLRGHRRPMIVIKAEKQDRARYCPTPENITAESITMCHAMPSHAITDRRVGSEIMRQDGWQHSASWHVHHNGQAHRLVCHARRMFRRVMDEALLMGNFVRLADIMLTEALSSHVIGTVKQLLEALQAPQDVLEADHTVGVQQALIGIMT